MARSISGVDMGSLKPHTWYAITAQALHELEGEANLSDIVSQVKKSGDRKVQEMIKNSPNWKVAVRATLSSHADGRGQDVFRHVRYGRWRLSGASPSDKVILDEIWRVLRTVQRVEDIELDRIELESSVKEAALESRNLRFVYRMKGHRQWVTR
jgi:hypothetical protein